MSLNLFSDRHLNGFDGQKDKAKLYLITILGTTAGLN